jgi:hypothetical protein
MVRIQSGSTAGKKTLVLGEVWDKIGGGYSIIVQSIDARASPRQAWVILRKDCVRVDDKVVSQGQYYNYSVSGITIQAYADSIFAGATSDMIQFRNTTVSSNIDVYYPPRAENWTCSPWSSCANKNQTRTCSDSNSCDPAIGKPNVSQHCNNPPTANAGPDQTVAMGTLVILDATASSDPENGTLTYSWSQISGPEMRFSNPASLIATFTPSQAGDYVLNLTVRDDEGATSSDNVTISAVNPAEKTATTPKTTEKSQSYPIESQQAVSQPATSSNLLYAILIGVIVILAVVIAVMFKSRFKKKK